MFVSVFFQLKSAATNDYLSILSGFPKPISARAGLSAHGANNFAPHLQATIESTGFLRLSGTFSVGENVSIGGVYFK